MASIHADKRRGKTTYRCQFYDKHKRRRSIRLGSINKRAAEAIAVRVDDLVSASISGGSPSSLVPIAICDRSRKGTRTIGGSIWLRPMPKRVSASTSNGPARHRGRDCFRTCGRVVRRNWRTNTRCTSSPLGSATLLASHQSTICKSPMGTSSKRPLKRRFQGRNRGCRQCRTVMVSK